MRFWFRRRFPVFYEFLALLKKSYVYWFGYIDIRSLALDYNLYWQVKRGANGAYLSAFQKRRARAIIRMLPMGAEVLDVGCGDGSLLQYLRENSKISGYGLDCTDRACQNGALEGFEFIQGDITSPAIAPHLPLVDYVIACEVLEHIAQPELALTALAQKARKGVIISVPNTGYVRYRARMLFGKFPIQWLVHPGEHLRFWTITDMRWWLAQLRLEIDKMAAYVGVPILKNLWPALFAEGVVILIKPASKHQARVESLVQHLSPTHER